jgi:hypothetical protein
VHNFGRIPEWKELIAANRYRLQNDTKTDAKKPVCDGTSVELFKTLPTKNHKETAELHLLGKYSDDLHNILIRNIYSAVK